MALGLLASKPLQGPIKDASGTLLGGFKVASRTLKGPFKEPPRTLQGPFKARRPPPSVLNARTPKDQPRIPAASCSSYTNDPSSGARHRQWYSSLSVVLLGIGSLVSGSETMSIIQSAVITELILTGRLEERPMQQREILNNPAPCI